MSAELLIAFAAGYAFGTAITLILIDRELSKLERNLRELEKCLLRLIEKRRRGNGER